MQRMLFANSYQQMELFHFCYDTMTSYQNMFSWLTFDQGYGKWRQKSHGKERIIVCVCVCNVSVSMCAHMCIYVCIMCVVFICESMLCEFVCLC